MNPLSFETWFKNTELYEYSNGVCKIIVPMAMYKKHLTTKYYDLIVNNLSNVVGDNVDIEFYTQEEIDDLKNNQEDNNPISPMYTQNNKETNTIHHFENTNFCSNLNKKFTFENFIVGNTNKFAQAAALEVAENPGVLYNPLFIYGNSGLGKTHLMHAIGNYITEHSKSFICNK